MSLSSTATNPPEFTRKSSSDETVTASSGYSWWSWRRPTVDEKSKDMVNKSIDYSSRDINKSQEAESLQKHSPNTTLCSQQSTDETNGKFKKTLRLTSQQIVS